LGHICNRNITDHNTSRVLQSRALLASQLLLVEVSQWFVSSGGEAGRTLYTFS
jgi:hypothetical protein